MATTYADIRLANSWIDIYSELGLSVGDSSLRIQNKGPTNILISLGTDPDTTSREGILVLDGDSVVIPSSVSGLYVRSTSELTTNTSTISIEPESNIQSDGTMPSDIFTSTESGIRRLSVDSQQTSFEDNKQFRYSSAMNSIATTATIVYKFVSTVPFNLFERKLVVSQGGRKYEVYSASDFDVEPSGTFSTAGRVSYVNNNLKPSLTEHPPSGMTVTRSIDATYTITSDVYPTTQAQAYVPATGTNSRTSSMYSPDGIRSGLAAGTYYVIMTDFMNTDNSTIGFIELVWEER